MRSFRPLDSPNPWLEASQWLLYAFYKARKAELCFHTHTHLSLPSGRISLFSLLGRLEFESYLPEGTQGVAVQPVGKQGILIAGTDTIRGISRLDQAWLSTIADKLEVTLEKLFVSKGVGFKA